MAKKALIQALEVIAVEESILSPEMAAKADLDGNKTRRADLVHQESKLLSLRARAESDYGIARRDLNGVLAAERMAEIESIDQAIREIRQRIAACDQELIYLAQKRDQESAKKLIPQAWQALKRLAAACDALDSSNLQGVALWQELSLARAAYADLAQRIERSGPLPERLPGPRNLSYIPKAALLRARYMFKDAANVETWAWFVSPESVKGLRGARTGAATMRAAMGLPDSIPDS